MIQKITIKQRRSKRVARIRAIIRGTTDCPRLSIYRSHKRLYGQMIDDQKQITLATVHINATNKESGTALGKQIAERCKSKKISRVVFDRGGYKYHGVIHCIAEAVRAEGVRI